MTRWPAAELRVAELGPTLVLSPHPDDESLAVGATLAALVCIQAEVRLVLASDGEGSHPDQPPAHVRRVRSREFAGAVHALGLTESSIVRLGLPDRAIDDRCVEVALAHLDLPPAATVIAPSLHDGHRDHRACARAAWQFTDGTRRRLLTYQVWPSRSSAHDPVPTGRQWVFPPTPELRAVKAAALACYRSQLAGTPPVVPAALVRSALAGPEVFTEERL
jgi:LmbE family N-acetylglucosaminyl deacetylase